MSFCLASLWDHWWYKVLDVSLAEVTVGVIVLVVDAVSYSQDSSSNNATVAAATVELLSKNKVEHVKIAATPFGAFSADTNKVTKHKPLTEKSGEIGSVKDKL
jgi:hypothetical protein